MVWGHNGGHDSSELRDKFSVGQFQSFKERRRVKEGKEQKEVKENAMVVEGESCNM